MAGWVIAVLLERPGARAPARRYFAVGRAERAGARAPGRSRRTAITLSLIHI